MKRFVAGIFVAIAVFTASAQPQKQQWTAYVYPYDGFGITLPAPANPQDDAGDPHIHLYKVPLGNGSIFSLRVVHRTMDCETTLADLWDKAQSNGVQRQPVVPESLIQVSIPGLQGLEYETTTPAGERILHRFHCGNKLFYIFSAGYKGKRPADLDRIINSFHVVNPVSANHPLGWGQGRLGVVTDLTKRGTDNPVVSEIAMLSQLRQFTRLKLSTLPYTSISADCTAPC